LKRLKRAKKHQEEAKSSVELKLDLACGARCMPGFEGVDRTAVKGMLVNPNDPKSDRCPDVKHVVDLLKFPWPWATDSVDQIRCSHFIEHLPARDVEEWDFSGPSLICRTELDRDHYEGKDFLFAFFDECYRILKPSAIMEVICPSARSERAFQDPTHRRFISQALFFYLAWPERNAMGLAHYDVDCDFEGNVTFTHDAELAARAPEYQQRVFKEAWNVIQDYVVKLKAVKPSRRPVQP
jgi:hypothetical protein